MPMNDHVAFTVEGGVNETYLPLKGTQQGRAAVGVSANQGLFGHGSSVILTR